MVGRTVRGTGANRAAIFARVSDKNWAEEDKTSLSEQVADIERYCGERGITIVAHSQEASKGEQGMLKDAHMGPVRHDRLQRAGPPQSLVISSL